MGMMTLVRVLPDEKCNEIMDMKRREIVGKPAPPPEHHHDSHE
jgi:hypothetical protein